MFKLASARSGGATGTDYRYKKLKRLMRRKHGIGA
jgi:hypothetical protein